MYIFQLHFTQNHSSMLMREKNHFCMHPVNVETNMKSTSLF